MDKKLKVAVVGAGPAGACAAYYLAKEGHDVCVYDKENKPGGRTLGYEDERIRLDTGAGFFTNFYPFLKQLVKEIGIEGEVVPIERRVGLRHKDTLAEFEFGDISTFFKLPFISWYDKMVMIWQTIVLTLKRPWLDIGDPGSLSVFDDESIAVWARKHMTENVYQYCIRPGVEPFWYFSCEDVSRAITTVLQGRSADVQFYTFRNGMSRISEALLNNIDFKGGVSVSSISLENGKYELISDHSLGHFDAVVMATPATISKSIISNDLLPDYLIEFMHSQEYVANVHAAYLVDAKDVQGMLAYYYPCGDWDIPIGAIVLHNAKCAESAKAPDGKELVSVYLLDEPSKALLDKPDDEVFEKVWDIARDFEPSLPVNKENMVVFKRSEAIPLHAVGRFSEADVIQHKQSGSLVFAGDYLSSATVEGALRSGRWAANKLTGKTNSPF